MSSTGNTGKLKGNALVIFTAREMWAKGGTRAYFKGYVEIFHPIECNFQTTFNHSRLSAGLIGVYPYSAIDMSTFEALKSIYLTTFHKDDGEQEMGILATLAAGSVSGGVGAGSVYPL
jgi:solute carrier family 25 (mitochondrial phosphate transporter), member 23/24/25/41